MNLVPFILVVIAAGALATGCSKSAEQAKEPTPVTNRYDYAYDKKDVYMADATADVEALDRRIDELADRTAKTADTVKAEQQPKVVVLRQQRAELARKLEDLRKSTAADWNEAKSEYLKSYAETKTSCENAWQGLTNKP